jgi:HlyD family secretion protein
MRNMRNGMSPTVRRLALRLLLVVAVAGGVALLAAWLQKKPVAVAVAEIGRGPVIATVANTRVGTVKACRRAQLVPQAGGRIATLPIHKGDHVEEGQLLLRIWNDDRQADLALAQRELVTIQRRAEEACSAAAGAAREAVRVRRLRDRALISEERVDQVETDATTRKAACDGAHAEVESAAARIAVAEKALERTSLFAPFAGVVAELNVELGEFVTPAPPGLRMDPAVDLVDRSCLYVSAPIDEVDAPKVRLRAHTCVRLDAFPTPRCSGVVRRIAPYVREVEKQARTVEVEVEIEDAAEREGLLPGYSADIEITLDRREQALRVPSQAIIGGNRVLILEDGRLVEHTFTPGIGNFSFTEVKAGLSAGQQVVTSVGREGVRAGAQARAEEPAAVASEGVTP